MQSKPKLLTSNVTVRTMSRDILRFAVNEKNLKLNISPL